MAFTPETVSFPSASDPSAKPHEMKLGADGKLSCTCRGWKIKRAGKPRLCNHIKTYTAERGLATEVRGDYVFALNGATVPTQATFAVVPTGPVPQASASLHGFVSPQLAAEQPANWAMLGSGTWTIEEKFDGHRVIVAVEDGTVRAWSRPKQGKPPLPRVLAAHVRDVLAMFPNGTYDGELIVPGGKSYDVVNLANAGTEIFVVFDLPRLLGNDITGATASTRRAYLDQIFAAIETDGHVQLSPSFPVATADDIDTFVKAVWAKGGEGAIVKRAEARYRPAARSADWLKVKAQASAVFTITGYKAGENGPYSAVHLVDADGIKTTAKVKNNALLALIAKNPQAFIGRELRCKYQERTPDGSYRHIRWDRFEDET